MGMLEVIVLATTERMVVTGLEIGMQWLQDFGVCRWAKPSHLQAGIEVGVICNWFCQKYS